ncbi:AzlC family ABC transporter permease [Blastococcus sp. Marseille-P5729]|uniref:AzlC family ABC transporter permease n=1 Tax=Blastococcus sp. Marseille-P5729 TaxID=2086582 RepID=UPI0018FEA248|nr:AzlC family ABC transporter permease [Blastococcus sp. Marseille-P5729]
MTADLDRADRSRVLRNGVVMGLVTGAYGLTFGALGVTSGLSLLQTCVLSLAMFTGGSQFAYVGVIAGGGAPLAGAAAAILLGARNTLYGLTLAPVLRVRGGRKLVAAQVVIDESTAMSMGEDDVRLKRLAFWSTGLAIYVLWNLGTLVGAVAAGSLPDPQALGLDAVAPAAFIFLFAARLTSRTAWLTALIGAAVALLVIPVVPAGLPVIVAAAAVGIFALIARGTPEAGPVPMTKDDPSAPGPGDDR